MIELTKEQKTQKAAWEAKRFDLWIVFLHFLAMGVLGLSLFPMIYFFYAVWKFMGIYAVWLKILAFSFSLAFGFFLLPETKIAISVFRM